MVPSVTYNLIWSVIRRIPKGRVSTYGRVADICGLIGQSRLVGYALHALPRDTKVPWYRVINAQGRISFPERSEAYRVQKRFLESERITFKQGKIDLTRFGWPPDAEVRRRRT
ncbi:MAG: MGMT family protein [Bacteroidota bacterium]